MAGRGSTTFQKRQKEQMRKEKRQEKLTRRQQKKEGEGGGEGPDSPLPDLLDGPMQQPEFIDEVINQR
jgi:hypothetical protein